MKCFVFKGRLYAKYTSDAVFDIVDRVVISKDELLKKYIRIK